LRCYLEVSSILTKNKFQNVETKIQYRSMIRQDTKVKTSKKLKLVKQEALKRDFLRIGSRLDYKN